MGRSTRLEGSGVPLEALLGSHGSGCQPSHLLRASSASRPAFQRVTPAERKPQCPKAGCWRPGAPCLWLWVMQSQTSSSWAFECLPSRRQLAPCGCVWACWSRSKGQTVSPFVSHGLQGQLESQLLQRLWANQARALQAGCRWFETGIGHRWMSRAIRALKWSGPKFSVPGRVG